MLTGAGERAFCTGADMKQSGNKTGLEYWAAARPGGFGGLALRETLDVPVIARVNGHALGGGMEMVLGCDIVVAAENASFGLPEPRVGRLALDGGIAILPRRIPHVWAMGMLLTGRRVPAAEALRLGLVNEVVPQAGLDAAVDRWLADILACAPLSVKAIKQMVRSGAGLSPQEAQQAAPAGPGRRPSVDRSGRGRTGVHREAPAAVAGPLMTYVVTSTCIDVKDGICQKVCPVECIYEGGRMMYIQPDECINCGICVSVCPVQAIYEDVDVPAAEAGLHCRQRRVLRRRRHRLGTPRAASRLTYVSTLDVPLVKRFPVNANPEAAYLQTAGCSALTPTCTMRGLSTPDTPTYLKTRLSISRLRAAWMPPSSRAGDQRPEGRGLRLLGGIGVEGEVDAGVGEIGMALGIGDPEFLDRRFGRDVLERCVDLGRLHASLLGGGDVVRGEHRLADHVLGEDLFTIRRPGRSAAGGQADEEQREPN